jgi:hypothetical protein
MVFIAIDILRLTVHTYLEMRCSICPFQNPENKIKYGMTALIIIVLYT